MQMIKSNSPHEQKVFVFQNFKVIIAEFGDFVKPYKNYGKYMQPWETKNIADSYNFCGSPRNPVLYKNKIYKCGPIANLRDTLCLFNLEDSPKWQKYLDYRGFSYNDDISVLLENFGKPEWICSMCPSNKEGLVDHYKDGSVQFKKESKC